MSEIQDEAYSEACEEIERLKVLVALLCDALGNFKHQLTPPDYEMLQRAREVAK